MSYKQKICTVFSKECWIWWWTPHFNSCHFAQYIKCASNFFLRTCIQVISNCAALYSLIYTRYASSQFTCNLHFCKSSSLVFSTNTHHFLPCFVYDMEGTANTSTQAGHKFLWTALMYMHTNTKSKARASDHRQTKLMSCLCRVWPVYVNKKSRG